MALEEPAYGQKRVSDGLRHRCPAPGPWLLVCCARWERVHNSTRYPWSFGFVHARLVTHAFASSVMTGSLGESYLSLRAVSISAAKALGLIDTFINRGPGDIKLFFDC